MAGEKKPEREIYIECTLRGGLMKVAAIDSVTGREVSVFGPAHARTELIRNATAKLEYVLKKPSSE